MIELPKNYNSKEVEEKWLNIWLEKKVFKSKINLQKENFSIALPPPNVTGNLHMGHAFGNTIQDALIRYQLMNGKNVLWQGGTDHAGIATQVLVERYLLKTEKRRKEDLGREEFLKRVWAWKEKHGNEITDQMKKLGCLLDYDRLIFTMDKSYSRAVRKIFVDLYRKGLIYRGKRIVNWCPKCLTSISDLEVETEHINGEIYHILYPFDLNNISKGGITVATTRPETMFGDIAVAVNPEDIRYKKLVGSKVYLPLIKKQIPIISDSAIEINFGTGALKVTPAHDAVDYEIFERNKELGTYLNIMSRNGKIEDKENIGIPQDIRNLDRFEARILTVKKLTELNLLKQVIEYEQPSSKHDRCNTIIEPYLSEQWFVLMKPLAKKAIEVVERGEIKFIPERYTEGYLNWLKHVKDWCISRQLWWGHQIPVWYKKSEIRDQPLASRASLAHSVGGRSEIRNEDIHVGEEPPKDIENYTQDPDVLDTWFSSALWPFVTLGWDGTKEVARRPPSASLASGGRDGDGERESEYFKAFYPTNVLATAREIINLWVSRMVFMSLEFTNQIPFKEVLIHPVIQTPDGKRMSKSKGNAIDPLEMIDKYGADANRFYYFSLGIQGNQDVRFPGRKNKEGKWESDTLEQYKRFANKLWNAVRFVLQNLDHGKVYTCDLSNLNIQKLTIPDKWILHRFTTLINMVKTDFEKYNLSEIAENIYKFIWDDFCDWYIEIAKRQLLNSDTKEQTEIILFHIVKNITKAIQPIMPFITEEIWQFLSSPTEGSSSQFVCFESYPVPDNNYINDNIDKTFGHVIELTREIRNQRQLTGIPWTKEIEVKLYTKNNFFKEKETLKSLVAYIEYLTKSKVSIVDDFQPIKPSVGALVSDTRILIPLTGLIDLDNMLNNLNKKKGLFQKELENQEAKLSNNNFINNASKDAIEEVRRRLIELENQLKTINEQVELLK